MEKQQQQITVIAKGESITHLSTFDIAYLDKLIGSRFNKSAVIYQLGQLLSEKPSQQSEKWRKLVEEALAIYVAGTKTYELIRALGFQTLALTIFSVDGSSGKGFQGRVVGTVSEKYEDIIVKIDGRSDEDKPNRVVLSFFQGAFPQYVEHYSEESVYHKLKAEAQSLFGKIEYSTKSNIATAGDVVEVSKQQEPEGRNDNPEDHAESLEYEFEDFDDE